MKKFNILIVLLLLSFQTFGQDNFPKLRQRLDKVFARIDKSQIPHGTLEENSFGFMNLWQMKRGGLQIYDTLNPIDNTAFRAAYATLETGKINENYSLLPIDSLNARSIRYIQQHPDHNPVMLLWAGYSYLDSNAVRNNQFTIVNNQLRDVANRTKSPYLTDKFLAASPEFHQDNDGTVTFVFPRELLMANLPLQSSGKDSETYSFQVSFGDKGNNFDFKPLLFDTPYTVNYTSTGMKAITVLMHVGGDRMEIAKTVIRINQIPKKPDSRVGGREEIDSTNITQTQRYEAQPLREFVVSFQSGVHYGCKLQIRLSRTNTLPQQQIVYDYANLLL